MESRQEACRNKRKQKEAHRSKRTRPKTSVAVQEDCQKGSVSVNSESGGPTDCQRVPSVSVCSAAGLANWRSNGTARRFCQCKFGTARDSQVAVQKDCQEGVESQGDLAHED